MEKKQLAIMFYIKKTKLLKNGDAPITIRTTYDGYYSESQIGRGVPIKLWSQARRRSIGKDRASVELNDYIEMIRAKINRIHQD